MLTGQKIAALRTKAGLTQEQLAEKLYMTRELISKWENGRRHPDHRTVLRLAEIFDVDPEEIRSRNDAIIEELSGCFPDMVDSETVISRLNDFLGTLSDRERNVFIRRYYFMEENSVIAENYRIKENNVRTILMRTRKKLTKYFKEMQHEKR